MKIDYLQLNEQKILKNLQTISTIDHLPTINKIVKAY